MATLNYSICCSKTLMLIKMPGLVFVLLVSGYSVGLLGPTMSVPAEALADSKSQYKIWEIIEFYEPEIHNCDHELGDTRILEDTSVASLREGKWAEEWILDHCGERVVYRVDFGHDDLLGGQSIKVKKVVSEVPKDD